MATDQSSEIIRRVAHRWRVGRAEPESLAVEESLAIEEPLEIRLGGRRFTLTMRTPGHDEELVAGFLLAEGFISSRAEIGEIRRMRRRKTQPDNVIDVILQVRAEDLRERLKRNFAISSSCGVCGKTSIESIQRRIAPLRDLSRVSPVTIIRLAPRMREAQVTFAATGGLHAAAIFDLAGNLRLLREDIGRHNAVDKAIGRYVMDGAIPLADSVMTVSGRASFEIVQKAAVAGIPILAAVSAPSSLAVELAEETGVTLVGFLRDAGFNVYAHPERIAG
ncbi:MAG TPA: formate dehydrogenase accessory sulfurtransferase FdhD [Candidatus Binataceae bacterium]|nr:formate dehydrogenase accessory sulfurtransferase FdhD [Candidatus Binataceae bacterium]